MIDEVLGKHTYAVKKCFLRIQACNFTIPCRCVNSSCIFRLAPYHVSGFQATELRVYAPVDKV